MDYSNFIILLARQRSGTHALRSILESHSDIFGVEEAFHLKSTADPNPGLPIPETNFFVFLKRQVQGDVLELLPCDHEPLFLQYLQSLRALTSKRYLVLDVKYNITHHIARNFQCLAGPPYLFELMIKHGLRTFVLTRKNYLRTFVSIAKTRVTQNFHVEVGQPTPRDQRVRLNVSELLFEFKRWQTEDQLVHDSFTTFPGYYAPHLDYRDKYFTWDYARLFSPATEQLAPRFSERFSNWLGIRNTFATRSGFERLSSLPLSETIENYADVASALRGTKFVHCLEDEPIQQADGAPRGWRRRLSNPLFHR